MTVSKNISQKIILPVLCAIFPMTVALAETTPVPSATHISTKPMTVWPKSKDTPVWPNGNESITKTSELSVYDKAADEDSFYEKEKDRADHLRELQYQDAALKLQTEILKLSLAARVGERMLAPQKPETIIGKTKDTSVAVSVPPPVENIRLVALFIKGDQKSAELMWNDEPRMVKEGEHVKDYVVQKIDLSGLSLKKSDQTIKNLTLG